MDDRLGCLIDVPGAHHNLRPTLSTANFWVRTAMWHGYSQVFGRKAFDSNPAVAELRDSKGRTRQVLIRAVAGIDLEVPTLRAERVNVRDVVRWRARLRGALSNSGSPRGWGGYNLALRKLGTTSRQPEIKPMAKRRIHRWLQFGVLDLLILTTIVAAGAVLWRPVQAKTIKAVPWVVGVWKNSDPGGDEPSILALLPDGCYCFYARRADHEAWRFRWTMAPLTAARDVFVLTCGERRLMIRSEWGSGLIEVLNENQTVRARLVEYVHLDGQMRDGMPDGEWRIVRLDENLRSSLSFRNGEPVDGHDELGRRFLYFPNLLRNARGLAELNDGDFAGESAPEEKTP